MANYVKSTNFTAKDTLVSGDPLKKVKGTEIDVEFNAIATAISSKADAESPTFTGTPTFAGTPTFTGATSFVGPVSFTGAQTTITNLNLGSKWTVVESGGVLFFKYEGVNKAKLDSSGNLTVTGNVTAYGSV